MNWKRFISPFVAAPIIGAILGNFSLGIIIAGLTGLIWGYESGVLFISITTTVLVILTGNINMEIIFLYVLTLTYLIREYKILHYIDRRLAYILLFAISALSFPIWKVILGLIPAGLLNELNISGELLVVAGLILFFLRGKVMLENGVQKKDFAIYILYFICSVVALAGNVLTIPLWIAGIYLFDRNQGYLSRRMNFARNQYLLVLSILIILSVISAEMILPIGYVTALILLLVFSVVFRNLRQVPLVEMVYFSMIVGIVAGRIGLLL